MNRQASLMRIFQLLKQGLSPEEIKAQFASPDSDTIDRIACSLDEISALREKPACSSRFDEADSASSHASAEFVRWLSTDKPSQREAGQIWSIDVPSSSRWSLAAILDTPEDGEVDAVTIAPIAASVDLASNEDFIVDEGESDLGYRFMVEAWHYGSVPSDYLMEFQGALSEQTVDLLLALYVHCLTHTPLDEVCHATDVDHDSLLQHIGEPLAPNDVRWSLRMHEQDEYAGLWNSALQASLDEMNLSTVFTASPPPEPETTMLRRKEAILRPILLPVLGGQYAMSKLAASDAKQQLVFRGQADDQQITAELRYNRPRHRLDLYFREVDERLANIQALVEICPCGHTECIRQKVRVVSNSDEPIVLANDTDVRETDVPEVRLILGG